MSFPAKSKALSQALIAVVFLFVNAGFTSVLHSCLTEDKKCCEMIMADGATEAENAIPSPSPAFNNFGSSCCENTIVGGLSGISALTESKGITETRISTSLHVVAAPFSPIIRPAVLSPLYFITRYPASPPTSEIYIFTSALLI